MMNTDPYIREMLTRFCKDNSLTLHQVWAASREMIDAEFSATFASDEEKTAEVVAAIETARNSKERNQFGNLPDPRIAGIKTARNLFGFGLREAVDFVDVLLAKGKVSP